MSANPRAMAELDAVAWWQAVGDFLCRASQEEFEAFLAALDQQTKSGRPAWREEWS
jgi:hypothetical protein